jgi:Asp-tRNA(Asn)/Glu-tRNA(Gln) amidotransferase A subunit family amidase
MPAVEYVQANRIRTLLMEAMAKIMADLDIYVAPQSRIDEPFVNIHLNLWLTNLTGHPAVVVPNGFARGGKPTGITFIGNLYDEGKLLALAKAYQDATEFHSKHPSAFGG